MEEKLEKILLDLNIGYITVKVAKRKILRLFAVSGRSELLKAFVTYAKSRSISDININDDTIDYFIEDFNLH